MSYESVEMKNERKDIMAEERVEPKPIDLGEYKFGFHDDVEPVLSTGKGLNEDVIRELSAAKGEPEWMLEFRLKSYETFKKMPMQTWGADLSEIDFDDLIYYQKPSDKPARSWDDVPEKIKETFERIGIPEAERAYLAGASAQYESEVVYHNMRKSSRSWGLSLQIRILPSRNTQTCLNNTLLSWYRRQITSWLPSTQQCGQVEPLSTYQKVSR